MTTDELRQRDAVQKAAVDKMQTAAARALGLLSVLVDHGYVPEHHRERARDVLASYTAALAVFDAMSTPLEPE